MRRAIAFDIGAGVIVLLLAALAVIESRHPTAWQEELGGHLARLSAEGDEVRLLATRRASRPDLFDGRLTYAVHGNESYTAKPLPYPPDALYCILLEHTCDGSSTRRQLVFVARHSDLHNADWVLHEGSCEPFDSQLIRDLRALGCAAVLDV